MSLDSELLTHLTRGEQISPVRRKRAKIKPKKKKRAKRAPHVSHLREITQPSPIVMYGLTLWPRTDRVATEEETKSGVWFFRDLLNLVETNGAYASVEAKGIALRFAVRAVRKYIPAIAGTVSAIVGAMLKNPDGLCIAPPMPKNGKW